MKIVVVVAVVPLLAALAACGPLIPEDLVPSPGSGECSGDLAITVSAGTEPEIAFDGDAAGLSVTEWPDGSTRMWTISQAGTAPFSGPVTYGVTPSGALETEGPEPLVAGTEYAVTVTAGDGVSSGCQQFTP